MHQNSSSKPCRSAGPSRGVLATRLCLDNHISLEHFVDAAKRLAIQPEWPKVSNPGGACDQESTRDDAAPHSPAAGSKVDGH